MGKDAVGLASICVSNMDINVSTRPIPGMAIAMAIWKYHGADNRIPLVVSPLHLSACIAIFQVVFEIM